MPIVLLAALAGSLAIHAAALFLPDVDLSTAPEAPVIVAEIQLPPLPKDADKPAEPPSRPKARPRPPRAKGPARSEAGALAAAPALDQNPVLAPAQEAAPVVASASDPLPEAGAPAGPAVETAAPAAPVEAEVPSRGFIRFAVYRGNQGLLVGRAEHSWEFVEGQYRLQAVTETVGLAAVFKPVRVELESRGSLTAEGLQPERFITRRDGKETSETADFDWEGHVVTLGRDGSRRQVLEGAQDLLSFHYQFSYLPQPGAPLSMGVATGKKFENYRFDPVGEETIETPAGNFRTLHVQVKTDSTTELWLAIGHRFLPVKIRHTDRKGESFEQVATELGL